MIQKILIGTLVLTFISSSFAETCPSISDIKNNKIRDWTAYDSDTKIALSAPELNHFKKSAEKFVLAEWSKKKNGDIHCYYSDASGSQLQAYFSKNSFVPEKARHHWYLVSGHMHCAAGNEECSFRINPMQQQLAQK